MGRERETDAASVISLAGVLDAVVLDGSELSPEGATLLRDIATWKVEVVGDAAHDRELRVADNGHVEDRSWVGHVRRKSDHKREVHPWRSHIYL